ncbi:MAG TPA: flagellar filament capping protein FliD [Terriglobales bacterium]|jgi:flagellar hook-associated protein 2|nr:flagellar filament capping protein FliD [Terriglobales bacterium]
MAISFNASALLNGNGIDVKSVVNAILNQQTGPLTAWQNHQTDLSTQAGILAGLNNNLTTLAATALSLADPHGPLASQSAVSSDSGILTATAQNAAASGTHQIVVSSLATTGTLYTNPLADGNTSFLANGASTGDIKLQVGGAGGTTHDIAITAGVNDAINTLASYINDQKWGVTANVVTDAGGARLALFSQSTGTPGALAIANNDTGLAFNAPVGGTNASLTIDGVPISSASNTVAGAISGVTLNLAGAAPDTTVQLTVGPDATAATTAINNFVGAYNSVIGIINTQFTVDPTTNTQGPLGADSTLRALQSRLLSDVTYSVSGNNGIVNLAALGIDLNNDGTLSVNQVPTETHPALSDVLAKNPGAVQSFFENASGTGFANAFNNDLFSLTDATDGIVNLDLAGNKTQQKALATQITNLQDRLSAQQQQLTALYSRVNATLESYPSLLYTVTSIIGALNGNFNVASPSSNTTPNTGTPTR